MIKYPSDGWMFGKGSIGQLGGNQNWENNELEHPDTCQWHNWV